MTPESWSSTRRRHDQERAAEIIAMSTGRKPRVKNVKLSTDKDGRLKIEATVSRKTSVSQKIAQRTSKKVRVARKGQRP